MDVRCPQCKTLYELDDDQVGERSVTLKCSQCQHVFRLGGRTNIAEENQRRWMVRRKDAGDILYLNTFDSLHEWIMKGTVCTADEVSRTGNDWVELGTIAEFQPMFQVVESISKLGRDSAEQNDVSSIATRMPSAPTAEAEPTRQEPHRERVRTSIQFGGAGIPERPSPLRTEDVTKRVRHSDVMGELPPSPPSEAPADGSGEPVLRASLSPLATADISREQPQEPAAPSSGVGVWIVVGVVVTAAVGAFLLSQDGFLREPAPDVVAIGATNSTTGEAKSKVDPGPKVELAIDAALVAAEQENDAIWTLWHETASKPFYIALDIAYAEADRATMGVEVKDQLRAARAALENGQLQKASKGFSAVLAKDPKNAAAVSGLGWAQLELGRSDAAARQFARAIRLNPGHGDAYIGLGSAQRQLGKLKEAYGAYDRYLGRFPTGPKASIASYQLQQLKKQLGM